MDADFAATMHFENRVHFEDRIHGNPKERSEVR
jgi:hypothetical protein